MGFQRARNEEQKQIRINQILAAANELYRELAYREITMDMIAARLDFSRANMSRYVGSKEEIFLLLFIRDLEAFAGQAILTCAHKGMSEAEFAKTFAGLCAGYDNLLKIGSILNTVIEVNIKPEKLAVYKQQIIARMQQLAKVLTENFAYLDEAAGFQMIQIMWNQLTGLYPSTNWSDTQKEAIRISGLDYPIPEFVPAMETFTRLVLAGYRMRAADKE